MDTAVVLSRAAQGIDAPPVRVEVHISSGLPRLSLVGLPETAVRESADRVRSALLNSSYEFPLARITINLSPADLPKEGARFDLPIALGILAASGQIPSEQLDSHEFVGEVALTGELHAIRGALPVAIASVQSSRTLLVPAANAMEAGLARGVRGYAAEHLHQVGAYLCGCAQLPPLRYQPPPGHSEKPADLADVKGQHLAKRALEISAAGRHNLLMVGPPGTGKTMLASRITGILPQMTETEAIETAAVHSISRGRFDPGRWGERPFRAPHHTASAVAMVGGGGHPRPGEISLAHHGVLFLDELAEFDRRVLEALREPLDAGTITISRAARQARFPARFQLIGAMNPCPCGFYGSAARDCRCTPDQIARYRRRISGPLMDRFDLQIVVAAVPRRDLLTPEDRAVSSATVRERVTAALGIQLERQQKPNAHLSARDVDRLCRISRESTSLLSRSVEQLGLSARAVHRVLRVARTIADLDAAENIDITHLGEAISYRKFDFAASLTP